ncbi:MAG: response regulator, partial [Pseudoxanthomonas sp.]
SAKDAASSEGVSALADSAHAIRRSIAALQATSPRIPSFAALAAQLVALRDSLPEARPTAVTVDDSAQGTYTEALPGIEPPVAPGDVELSAHDLSAYFGDKSVGADVAEPVGSDSDRNLPSDDQQAVSGTDASGSAPPAVTFFNVELTYVREPVSQPVEHASEATADETAAQADGTQAEAALPSAQDEEPVLEEAAIADAGLEASVEADEPAGEVAAEADVGEQPAGEEPPAEEPAVEEPAVEEPTVEEPAVEELAVEELAVEELSVEEPAVEEPAFEAVVDEVRAEETQSETIEPAETEAVDAASAEPDAAEPDAIESGATESDVDVVAAVIDTVEPPSDVVPEQPAVEARVQETMDTETTEPGEPVEAGGASPVEDAAEEREAAAVAQAATPALADDALDFSELDLDLVDIFVEEGNDLLDHSDGLLAKLRETPEDRSLVTGLQRDLHTIKGGARMAGINAIGDLGHAIESLLEQVAAQRIDLDSDSVRLLERGFDGLHGLVTKVGAHRKAPMPTELIAEFEHRAHPQAAVAAALAVASGKDAVSAPPVVLAPLSAPIDTAFAGDDEAMPYAAQEQVRVRADLLDRLVNHAGEVAIYRSRLEQQLGAFRGAMSELDRTNIRLHDQLRRLDLETEAQIVARYQREQDKRDPTFDPLELDRFSTLQQLSRGLAESAADITGLQGVLDDLARQYDTLLQQQSRVSSELQDGLMRARMVPFDGLVPRLRRVLRQAATDTGKQVKLHLDGAHGELDRNVLERMTAPLEHLLRNAVAHGLESPKQRRKKSKPEEGTVQIALRREGAEMVFQVSDDGAGIDHAAIRRRAEQRGMLQSDTHMSDTDLERLILESGFSTSDSISQLAGRGVGMDVVYSEVRQLGGSLEIASESGKGTTFTLRLPQTLAVTQAVFVQIGETQFAVPVAAVGGVGRISRDRFETAGAVYVYGGEEYVLHDLGALIGQGPARAEGQPQVPLLLVRAGDLRAAVAVDQVLGNREIVVKPVGPQIASVPGIYGATITGDGRIVVILDVAPLVRRHILQPNLFVSEAPAPEERRVPLVMVVDDSLTMRKVTGRVLERHNFEVTVARDGVEALERLEERVPDLMLLDIEMPRMDGYELATAMKADPRFKDVPIVMITSRTGDKHRQRAMEIGVQRYMGKPYQELDLMRNVYDLLGIARVRE